MDFILLFRALAFLRSVRRFVVLSVSGAWAFRVVVVEAKAIRSSTHFKSLQMSDDPHFSFDLFVFGGLHDAPCRTDGLRPPLVG